MGNKRKEINFKTIGRQVTKSDELSVKPQMDLKSNPVTSRKWIKLGLLGVAVLLMAGYGLRSFLVVAIVDGKPVFRHSLIRELEKQGGKQVLDRKITEMLIWEEANKQGKAISETEVDEEIKKIEEKVTLQGQNLDTLLAAQGMDRYALRNQIRIQKLIEQMLPEAVVPTEEEIAQALEEQADTFPKEMSEEDRKTAVVNQLNQQKQSTRVEDWIQSLKDKAKIEYWMSY